MSCRIFIGNISGLKKGDEFRITGDESKYVARVLRLLEGDPLIISGAGDTEYSCTVKAIEKKSVLLTVASVDKPLRESPLKITLCQSLPKSKKMDLIIQKCTELGVSHFIPFVSSRSISRPDEKESSEKGRRWSKIAMEASRQCGRTVIPDVDEVMSFEELLESLSKQEGKKTLKIIPWESEEGKGLRNLANQETENLIIIIGPEGGFSSEEVKKAEAAGFIPVSIGPRLLRTETAGFSVVSMAQYIWGDMG